MSSEVLHGRLSARNPYVGYFKHAPRSTAGFASLVLEGEVITPADFMRAKMFRRNPHTGIFHRSPGVYSSLHVKFQNQHHRTALTDVASPTTVAGAGVGAPARPLRHVYTAVSALYGSGAGEEGADGVADAVDEGARPWIEVPAPAPATWAPPFPGAAATTTTTTDSSSTGGGWRRAMSAADVLHMAEDGGMVEAGRPHRTPSPAAVHLPSHASSPPHPTPSAPNPPTPLQPLRVITFIGRGRRATFAPIALAGGGMPPPLPASSEGSTTSLPPTRKSPSSNSSGGGTGSPLVPVASASERSTSHGTDRSGEGGVATSTGIAYSTIGSQAATVMTSPPTLHRHLLPLSLPVAAGSGSDVGSGVSVDVIGTVASSPLPPVPGVAESPLLDVGMGLPTVAPSPVTATRAAIEQAKQADRHAMAVAALARITSQASMMAAREAGVGMESGGGAEMGAPHFHLSTPATRQRSNSATALPPGVVSDAGNSTGRANHTGNRSHMPAPDPSTSIPTATSFTSTPRTSAAVHASPTPYPAPAMPSGPASGAGGSMLTPPLTVSGPRARITSTGAFAMTTRSAAGVARAESAGGVTTTTTSLSGGAATNVIPLYTIQPTIPLLVIIGGAKRQRAVVPAPTAALSMKRHLGAGVAEGGHGAGALLHDVAARVARCAKPFCVRIATGEGEGGGGHVEGKVDGGEEEEAVVSDWRPSAWLQAWMDTAQVEAATAASSSVAATHAALRTMAHGQGMAPLSSLPPVQPLWCTPPYAPVTIGSGGITAPFGITARPRRGSRAAVQPVTTPCSSSPHVGPALSRLATVGGGGLADVHACARAGATTTAAAATASPCPPPPPAHHATPPDTIARSLHSPAHAPLAPIPIIPLLALNARSAALGGDMGMERVYAVAARAMAEEAVADMVASGDEDEGGDRASPHSTLSDTSGASGSDSEAPYEFVSPHGPNPALATTHGRVDGGRWYGDGDDAGGRGTATPQLRLMRSADLRHMLSQYQQSVRASGGAGVGVGLDLTAPGDWVVGADIVTGPAPAATRPHAVPLTISAMLSTSPTMTSPSVGMGRSSSAGTFGTVDSGVEGGGTMGFQWPSFEFLATPMALGPRGRGSGGPHGTVRRDSDYSGGDSPHADLASEPSPPTPRPMAVGGAHSTLGSSPTGTGTAGGVASGGGGLYGIKPGGPGYLLGPAVGAKHVPITQDYVLGAGVGQGGYAAVKVATSLKRNPPVSCVVKCIRKRYLLSAEEKDSVAREVEIHRSLSHPNIVSLWDTYEDENDYVYLVMERVQGGDLASYIRRKAVRQFSELQVRVIFDQLLNALEYMHSVGVLHADIKPDNILLAASRLDAPLPSSAGVAGGGGTGTGGPGGAGGELVVAATDRAAGPASGSVVLTSTAPPPAPTPEPVARAMGVVGGGRRRAGTSTSGAALTSFIDQIKVCDFGAARRSRDARYYRVTGDVGLVPWTSVQGTMGYIAPEILNRRHYNAACDIWSCGVLMFELLGGYAPWYPYSTCLTLPVTFPPVVWDSVSSPAKDLIKAMLQPDPAKRITAAAARAHPWFHMVG